MSSYRIGSVYRFSLGVYTVVPAANSTLTQHLLGKPKQTISLTSKLLNILISTRYVYICLQHGFITLSNEYRQGKLQSLITFSLLYKTLYLATGFVDIVYVTIIKQYTLFAYYQMFHLAILNYQICFGYIVALVTNKAHHGKDTH